MVVLGLLFVCFATMVVYSHRAYRIQADPVLPKLDLHYKKRGHLEEWRTREQLFAEITDALAVRNTDVERY